MKRFSRLLLYVLLNIIISSLTTLTVLWLWDRAHPTLDVTKSAGNIVSSTPEHSIAIPTPSSDPHLIERTEDIQVVIRKVVGAGNLEVEYVEIYNQSNGAVDLTGWQLLNEAGQRFLFPTLILNSDGAIEVHSKAGKHTVIELYWQAGSPIWKSGEMVTLLDNVGKTMATYSIP